MVALGKRGVETDDSNDDSKGNYDLSRVVIAGLRHGLKDMMKSHPRFKKSEYLASFLDREALEGEVEERMKYLQEYGITDEKEVADDIYRHIASQTASGRLFDENGKEIVLRKGLEDRTRGIFGSWKARGIRESEKYLDKTIDSFSQVYELLKTGDYATRMPELTEAVVNIYDSGFLDSALNILYEKKALDGRKYDFLKGALNDRVRKSEATAVQALEKYITGRTALAASILAVLGIWVLFASNNITGNIIGVTVDSSKNTPAIFFGASLLIFSSLILLWKKIRFK